MTDDARQLDLDVVSLPEVESGWLQADCALAPGTSEPWDEVGRLIDGWRSERRFAEFGFVRKPPGWRLRFGGDAVETRLAPELWSALSDLTRAGVIAGSECTIYEPEVHRFGGTEGMAIAHGWTDRDSDLAIRAERLPVAQLARPDRSLAIVSDLVAAAVDDGAEAWDVWMRLASALRVSGGAVDGDELERVRAIARWDGAWLASLAPSQRDLLGVWRQAHSTTGLALRQADRAGRLTIGRRRWLASACVFHWNRAGLTLSEIAHTLSVLTELWRPAEHRP